MFTTRKFAVANSDIPDRCAFTIVSCGKSVGFTAYYFDVSFLFSPERRAMQITYVTKFPSNFAPQGKINGCIHPKALAKLSYKAGTNARTLFDPSNGVRPFGRPCWKMFVQIFFFLIKFWIEFPFDQTLHSTILLDTTTSQCFAAFEIQQSCALNRVTSALLAYHKSLSYFQAYASSIICRWRRMTKRTSWLLINS